MEKLCNQIREDISDSDQKKYQEGISVTPDKESMLKVVAYVEEHMEEAGVGMREMSKVSIAVDELFSNITQYSKASWSQVVCTVAPETVQVVFRDNGIPYNPLNNEEPDISLSAEERVIGGLGIFMTRKLMDQVKYEYIDEKNEVTIILNRK